MSSDAPFTTITENPAPTRASKPLVAAASFTLTVFTSASLLFFVQPLFTKIVLPQIGGAPAVWTTAMLFFQTVLIAGYVYAHLSARYLPPVAQIALHLALWALALWFIPLTVPAGWSYDATRPAEWQALTLYALGVGMPFAVLSANAPLLQSWYARSGGPSADDPYFLYSASNLGSLTALLAFPLAAEPLFGATAIGRGWATGFVALGLLILASGLLSVRHHAAAPVRAATKTTAPRASTLALWAFIAFVPSSLMLGVTSKIGTDLGSIPLVWVVPLALYLASFVFAFSARPLFADRGWRNLLLVSLAVVIAIASDVATLTGLTAILLATAFFGVAVFAHRILYLRRPAAENLTLFYITMSVGGALGGVFNSLVAPHMFNDLYEVQITACLGAALLLLSPRPRSVRDVALGLALAALATVPVSLTFLAPTDGARVWAVAAIGVVLLAGFTMFRHRALSVVAASVATLAICVVSTWDDAIFRDRSFFGTHAIVERDGVRFYKNGSTVHGAQFIADSGKPRPEPLLYYSADGPMGQIMASHKADGATVGVVGLGVGALACYRRPGQDWHFYEIDKTVDDIARNPTFFSFMANCAGDAPTHLGDARIVLSGAAAQRFDILVIDAYSSDSVPVHLTTREAVALYRSHLKPGGIVVFHISNRFYAIDRPLGRIAEAVGMEALIQRHGLGTHPKPGYSPSIVVVMGESPHALDDLRQDTRWQPLVSDGGRVWTDDYANPLSILQ